MAVIIEAPETYGHPADDPTCSLIWQRHHPDTGTQWPIVLLGHGGGFEKNRYNSDHNMQVAADELAAHGYQAICIDYRNNVQFLPGQTTDGNFHQQTDDVKLAITTARGLASFNGTKVQWVGGSTGGHHGFFCAGTGTIGADRLDSAICFSGPYDFTDRTPYVYLDAFARQVRAYCRVPDDSGGNLAIQAGDSPINQIDALISPVLLVASPNDDLMPTQPGRAQAKLDSLGVTNYQRLTEGTNEHAFEHWPLCHATALAFFDAILGGSPPPPPQPGSAFIVCRRK